MSTIREVLRLRHEAGLSIRQISVSSKLSVGSIQSLLLKAAQANLKWPLADDLNEEQLASRLNPAANSDAVQDVCIPDWGYIHQELKRKGVTRQLLWEEYMEASSGRCYSYSQFCALHRDWTKRQKRSMRQIHRAGEKCFVDYCGVTVTIINPDDGSTRAAQVFVAALGASNYTYAEATWSQALPDWLASQTRMLSFFGGVPRMIVPDTLKSGVSKACRDGSEVRSDGGAQAASSATRVRI